MYLRIDNINMNVLEYNYILTCYKTNFAALSYFLNVGFFSQVENNEVLSFQKLLKHCVDR